MSTLEICKTLAERIIVGVSNLRRVILIIQTIMPRDFGAQRFDGIARALVITCR